ncbi:MAG: site-2 protease family protein [Ruminococcus sp.]|nr:site-2 protease family protein [Ruminococcus sp.]
MNFFQFDFFTIIARIIVILLILPVHEFAHAFVARRCGDRTAEYSGRLTFNPFSHVDPIGALLLLLTGFGWAKPVPIDPRLMRNPRRGIILTSLAGPGSNLIVAYIALVLYRFLFWIPMESLTAINTVSSITTILFYFISINIGLALFNLIPIPPLDGSKVLIQFLPTRAVLWMQQNQMLISIVFLVVICTDILDRPLGWLGNWVLTFFSFATDWVDLLMNAIIG